MIGRILLYGLAFGSASAALTYVHFVNALYADRQMAAISIFAGVLIVGIAAFMFVKSLSHSDVGVKMGKALFGTLCVGLIISVCTIICYGTVLGSMPEVKEDMLTRTESAIENKMADEPDTTIKEKTVKVSEMIKTYEANISTGNFGKIQLMTNLSICMVVSLITFLYQYRHTIG